MNAFILAAGEGTRFRPHTLVYPKPSLPLLNIPMMSFPYAYLSDVIKRGNSLENLVINTFHLPQKIHGMVDLLPKLAKQRHFSDEMGEILGSGGGLAQCEKFFANNPDDVIVMINGDEVFLPTHREFLANAIIQHKSTGVLATLIVTQNPEVGKQFGGVWAESNYTVKGFGKICPTDKKLFGWHFIGIQILSAEIFQYLEKNKASNILYDGLNKALLDGKKVNAFPVEGIWFETGNLSDYLRAHDLLLKILWEEPNSNHGQFLKFILQEIGGLEYSLRKLDQGLVFICRQRFLKAAYPQISSDFVHSKPWSELSKIESLKGFLIADSSLVLKPKSHFENVILAPSCKEVPELAKNQLYLD